MTAPQVGIHLLLWTTHVEPAHAPLLHRLKARGFDAVEVPLFSGTPAHYAAIGRMIADAGLQVGTLGVFPDATRDPLSDDPATRQRALDHARWLIDCNHALGSGLLGGPLYQAIGHLPASGGPTATERDRAADLHRAMGAHAAAAGVTVALEAVNRFEAHLMTSAAEIAAHVDSVGHPAIAAMHDTFHAHVEERDPVAAIATLGHRLRHVHLGESDRGTPGRGQVPWARVFAALRAAGYDGWLMFEVLGRSMPDFAAATRMWRDVTDDPDRVCDAALALARQNTGN
jgi:D-psicose/D-tagatose/L-ribulose 3-epimerase